MSGSPVSRTINIYINQASAERAYQNLKKQQDKLTEAVDKGTKAGKDMTSEMEKLADTRKKMDVLEQQISGKLAPSIKQVKARVSELRRELEGMSADAEEFGSKKAEFDAVTARLKEMQRAASGVGVAMEGLNTKGKKLSEFINTVKGVALGTIIGNTTQAIAETISGYISGIVDGNARLSDSLADVKKATGLTTPEVEALNAALSKIDTRTSHEELRKIAIGLGQIGEAATPEAIASIDKIVVALGDEFGGGAQEITTQLGVLRNNLQDIKTGNYGADMLHIGNALNVLGAEGIATAPVVVDFATRLAGIAGTFGATSGQILGLSATLQELGIPAERGATAVTKLLQKVTSETAKYATIAKYAGINGADFAKLVNSDVVGALVKVAEGARKAGSSNQLFGKILKELDADGSGVGEVLSKVAKNADMLAGKIGLSTKALKDSSSITQEFDTKNNTLAATLEKIGKRMASAFTNSNFLKGIQSMVLAFADLVGAIDHSHDALNAFKEQQERVNNLEKNILPLIQRYEELTKKAEELGGASKLSKEEQVELNKAIQTIANTIPGAITEFDKYGRAIRLSTDQAREYIKIQRLLLQEKNREAIKAEDDRINKLTEQLQQEKFLLKRNAEERAKYGLPVWETDEGRKRLKENADLRKKVMATDALYTAGIPKAIARMGELQNSISGAIALKKQLMGLPLTDVEGEDDTKKPATDSGYKPGPTKAEIARAKAEKRREETAAEAAIRFNEKIAQLQADLEAAGISNDEKEIQRVRDKYQKLENEAQAYFRKYKKQLQEAGLLSKLEAQELEQLYKKQLAAEGDKYYGVKLQELSDFYNKEKQVIGQAYADGKLTKRLYTAQLKSLDTKEATDRAGLAANYADLSKKAAEDLEGAKTKALQKGIDERDKLETQSAQDKIFAAQRAVLIAPKGSNAELEAQKALLKAKYDAEIANGKRTADDLRLLQTQYYRDLKNLDRDFMIAKVNTWIQGFQQVANVVSNFFAYQNQKGQDQLDADRYQNDQKKKNLQKSLDGKRISQTTYNKAIEKLDADYAKKEAAIKHKQFQREKSAALTQAFINGALGITEIWAKYADVPYYAAALTAIEAIAVGTQIATISSKKEPQYAMGGIANGPSHADGGIAMVDNSTGRKVGEMEGGEAYMILSKQTTKNNGPLINELLSASMYGGGRPVRPKYLYQAPNPVNYSRAQDNLQFIRMYSGGGVMQAGGGWQATNTATQSYSTQSSDGNSQLISLLGKLNDTLAQGVQGHFYWNQWDRMNKQMTDLKKQASLGAKS